MGISVYSLNVFNWLYEMSGSGGAAAALRWADCLYNPPSLERHKGPTRTILSANKTGQIDSNTRQVVRQQKQLDDFEAMMLTSLVESAYDKAILQFDYEMQMMSLGGE